LKVEDDDNAETVTNNEFGWLENQSFASAVKVGDSRYCTFLIIYLINYFCSVCIKTKQKV